MADSNEKITLINLLPRMVKKFAQPNALKGLKKFNTPNREGNVSLGQLLEEQARVHPQHIALRFEGREWTWSELNAWVNQWAALLAEKGAGKGKVVAINLANTPETVVATCATAKTGATAAMINVNQTGAVLEHSLKLVDPEIMIAGPETVEHTWNTGVVSGPRYDGKRFLVKADKESPLPEGWDDLAGDSLGYPTGNPESMNSIQGKDPCFYIFTSGTTGLPKASIMSHDRWVRAAHACAYLMFDATENDAIYCCLPLYHNNALTLTLGCSFVSGATLVLSRKFSASNFWDEIREGGVTLFLYIGELLRYLMNQPVKNFDKQHSVRAIGGNGLRPDIWDQFKERYGIDRVHEFYGASEGTTGFMNVFNYDKTVGFCPKGWCVVKYDVEIDEPVRNAKGRMIKLKRGQTGLLLTEISDSVPFDGYTDRDASEKKILRNVFRDGDAWFNTGDLIKKIGWGHAQFVDRVGDTFRWQGENVATTEVEAVVNNWPQTADAVVYGVQVPSRDGRAGMLSLTLKDGEQIQVEQLAAHLRAHLPSYAVPRFMRVRTEQTVTGTFKHQKAALKKEGYDPDLVSDDLYFLSPSETGWKPLKQSAKAQIDSGEIRL